MAQTFARLGAPKRYSFTFVDDEGESHERIVVARKFLHRGKWQVPNTASETVLGEKYFPAEEVDEGDQEVESGQFRTSPNSVFVVPRCVFAYRYTYIGDVEVAA